MSTADSYSGGYLSDDQDLRLRAAAPVQCRLCRHLATKISAIAEKPLMWCDRPVEAPNSDILAALLMQASKAENCPFCSPFTEILS